MIINFIDTIQIRFDQFEHFVIGAFLWYFAWKLIGHPWSFLIAASICKELYDIAAGGVYDPCDIGFSAMGAAFFLALKEWFDLRSPIKTEK